METIGRSLLRYSCFCSWFEGDGALHDVVQGPKKHTSISLVYKDVPALWGFIVRGFIWDIPILIFAYVLLLGPSGVPWYFPRSAEVVPDHSKLHRGSRFTWRVGGHSHS